MLLCVAGGGSSGFNRDRSREGARCSAQSTFVKNQQIMVEERCSMTRAAVHVSPELVAAQDSVCLDPRASRSVHNKYNESNLTYRGKVIVVRGEDSVSDAAGNGETCATTTTFKSNIVNGKRSTNTILVRYKPSKAVSQPSDDNQSESGGRNDSFQTPHTSVSSSSSTVSSESSTSSKKDTISTSAWAQIMELEGYRSPAIGLDNVPNRNNENTCDTECTDISTDYSKDNQSSCSTKLKFSESSYRYPSSYSDKWTENCAIKDSAHPNRDLNRGITEYNLSFPGVSHVPNASSEENYRLTNKSNWCGSQAEIYDKTESNYSNYTSVSSNCSDKISEDSLTLHCSLPSEKNYIRVAQKVKSPMYRSESSRVPKTAPLEKNKSRRKTLPDGNLQLTNDNSKISKCSHKKQCDDIDPNASWGHYNARAMRESVRKVAQKYAETVHLRRQTHSQLDALPEVKGVQLTRFVSPYSNQDHTHSSTNIHCFQNDLYGTLVPSAPSHLHEVAFDTESNHRKVHLLAPTSTHHNHSMSSNGYVMNCSHKRQETKSAGNIENEARLDHNYCASYSEKSYSGNESISSNSDKCSSKDSQVNYSSGESNAMNCDESESSLCSAYKLNSNYLMCDSCSKKSAKCSSSYQASKCLKVTKNENTSLKTTNEHNTYFSVHIRDIKSKLCPECAQAAESGPPSKHSASRSKCHKLHNSVLSYPNICSSFSQPKRPPTPINDSSLYSHSHPLKKDDSVCKSDSSKRCTRLTAREMANLVHGSNTEKITVNKIPPTGVTSKVTSWIQKQKDKRKPVFFIGDAPTFFSGNYKEGDLSERSLNSKSKRSLSLSSVRENEVSSHSREFAESTLNLSAVRLNPSTCDGRDHDHKHLYVKRATSSCSIRGSTRRKIRQGSPVREEKESVAKNFNDQRNQVDGCIASWNKPQNNTVKNTLCLDNPTYSELKDATFEPHTAKSEPKSQGLHISLGSESLPDDKKQNVNSYNASDINLKTENREQKFPEKEESVLNESSKHSLGDSCRNLESFSENKNERSSFSKRLLNIKQLTRALSLHTLKKKRETLNESQLNKGKGDDLVASSNVSKWTRSSKRKLDNSKYGSLRKSLSYCELAVREATVSGKSKSQQNAFTEIRTTPKSSARTSVSLTNSVCCCSATLRRSVSLYWKFPLNRCLEYSVDEQKSDFLARLCFSRLHRRNGVPPFLRQMKNKKIVDKMKDSDGSKTVYDKQLHSLDIPKHEHPDRIPVIILPNFTGSDANILRKRAASTSDYSPKSKAIQRPVSVADYLTLDNSPCTKVPDGQNDLTRTASDTTSSEEQQKNLTSLDQIWRANPVKLCRVHSRLLMCRHKGRYRLRRSISQPVELEMTGSVHNLRDSTHGSADHENFQKGSLSSDDEASSESDIYHSYCCSPTRRSNTCWELSGDGTMYAEALWDHETIDPEELPFQAGDIIEVTDTSDHDWWWGTKDGHGGWFPSAFVRLYVSHRTPSLHFNGQQTDRIQIPYSPCKVSMNNLSCEQVRANIVQEIVATERDYVKHLKDVVEGYLKQVHRRPDMFSKERIETVFGNIKEIYTFQSQFLKQLEECLDKDAPHLSQIGNCFLNHKEEFKMYSQYCNNHPLAVSELQELYCDSQYIHFFEACRLLQEMIDISLDGFLLTPIQRICKYPLQLAELLKFTEANHLDHVPVTNALAAMKEVAELVNERKRRMECLERIAEWQNTIEGWEGPDVLDTSSILIHCGEVTRVSSSWSRDIYLFIFDHQLIYCKKDLLKRHTYAYKGRLNLDHCDIVDVEDGKDSQFAVNVKNAWKIYCKDKDKWYLFYAKTSPEKDQWLRAFKAERQRVIDDEKQAFVVTEEAKKSARLAVHNKQKPKRPRAKFTKGRRCHPDVAVTELLLDSPSAKARSGSLPSNIHPELAIMAGAKLGPTRKKGSGWFHFGSGKKPKS